MIILIWGLLVFRIVDGFGQCCIGQNHSKTCSGTRYVKNGTDSYVDATEVLGFGL